MNYLNIQIIDNVISWLEINKGWVFSALIAFAAFLFSVFAFIKSSRLQKKQLLLENETAKLSEHVLKRAAMTEKIIPALFLIELDNHLASLVLTLDRFNPIWMHRHIEGIFNRMEFYHTNIKDSCYNNNIEGIYDITTKILLDKYYAQVVVFNIQEDELLNIANRVNLRFYHLIINTARLINTAVYLSEKLVEIIDKDVLTDSQVKLSIESLKSQKNYYTTVCNASDLDIASLKQLINQMKHEQTDEGFDKKYPHRGYIEGLYNAATDIS